MQSESPTRIKNQYINWLWKETTQQRKSSFKKMKGISGIRISLFLGPLVPLLWTSGDVCPGFQIQDGFLICMLHCLHTTAYSDSPMVWHLRISWWPAVKLGFFDSLTFSRTDGTQAHTSGRYSVWCAFRLSNSSSVNWRYHIMWTVPK